VATRQNAQFFFGRSKLPIQMTPGPRNEDSWRNEFAGPEGRNARECGALLDHIARRRPLDNMNSVCASGAIVYKTSRSNACKKPSVDPGRGPGWGGPPQLLSGALPLVTHPPTSHQDAKGKMDPKWYVTSASAHLTNCSPRTQCRSRFRPMRIVLVEP